LKISAFAIAPTAASGVSTNLAGRATAWRNLLPRIFGAHFLALADQAVVSAASFLTTIIISRFTDPSQLGAYAIAISVLASAYTIQGQLISLPYSIQRHRPIGTPAEHAGSSLALSGLLSALATLVLTIAALSLFADGAGAELTGITWALAAVMPFSLFRDFFRRFAFTHLQMAQALILDTVVAVIQLAMLAWLGWSGQMSAITACGALGASCGIAAAGWLYLARADFALRLGSLGATVRQSWNLGRWLVVNQVMVQVQRYITYWLAVIIAGAAVTGVYTACMSIVAFSNPLFFGLNNILTQGSILAWKEGGGRGLRRRAMRDLLLLTASLGPFCLLVLFFGEDVMRFVFHGPEYEGQGRTIAVLAFATLASAFGSPASNALASMERPRAIFAINAVGTVVTVALIWWMMVKWGLLGAAFGWLSGNAAVTAGLWVGFLALVPRAHDPAPIIQALEKLAGASDVAGWAVTRLGEGDHSNVYAVTSADPQPVWGAHRDFVVKLYKPEAGLGCGMVQEQFDSLNRLHAALDGRCINGWTISTPQPLQICEAPLALAMTTVSARKDLRSSAAADENLTPDVLDALGRACVGAMADSWSRGQMHGDLALQNILYDIRERHLSFIDPGTRECCNVCNDVATHWRPAALELGHILRDLGTDVRDLIGNPIARLRRQIFVESALRAYLETLGSRDDKQHALDEIKLCAREHLSKVLALSWSVRGIYHWLLTQLVVPRMDSIVDRLRAELKSSCPLHAAQD
jgi:O-antigen/teichoic acid export membrane protein